MAGPRKSILPPAPPGWDARGAVDPAHDARRLASTALTEWARWRGYAFEENPDVGWYQQWAPFVYLGVPQRVERVVQAAFGAVRLWVAEVALIDPVRAAMSPQPPPLTIVCFVIGPQLTARAALRSRSQNDPAQELHPAASQRATPRAASRLRAPDKDRFTRRTYGRGGRSVLGDPSFDGAYDFVSPTVEEARIALPSKLRALLTRTQWRGVIEVRPGGIIVEKHGPSTFEPTALDATIAMVGQLYSALVRSGYADSAH